jgi:sortase A
VYPDAVRVLQPTEKPRLTLITCYPFNWVGAAPQRLVVVAEPVSAPARPGKAPAKTGG